MATPLASQMQARVPIVSKYRSRLMLSYRTNISGTPLTERIPFRVLVLGQFTGLTARKSGLTPVIAERKIRSIRLGQVGTSVDDYMREMKPWMRVPGGLRPLLEASVPGSVSFATRDDDGAYRSTLTVIVTDADKDGPITAEVVGTAQFVSTMADNNQANIEADDFKVSGEISLEKAEDGSLAPSGPVELMISGAATKGLVDRFNQPAGVLAIIGDGERLRLDPGAIELVPIVDLSGGSTGTKKFELFVYGAGGDKTPKSARMAFKRALPFTSTTGFTPDSVASNVPELKRLKVIRDLVAEVPSTARNNPAFHAALRVALPTSPGEDSERQLGAAQSFQAWAKGAYPELMVDQPDEKPPAAPLSKEGEDWLNELLKPVGGSVSSLYALDGESIVALVDQREETGIEGDASTMMQSLVFRDRDPTVTDAVRIANALAALIVNLPAINTDKGSPRLTFSGLIEGVGEVAHSVDKITGRYLDGILHDAEFKALESNWMALADLSRHVTTDEVIIDFYDATKDELGSDLVDNRVDIFGSVLFNRVYVDEYDRYGGRPFATMIGLYAFDSDDDDIAWLHSMMSVCAGAHCPFISSVKPEFFNGRKSMDEVAAVTDLDAIMSHPRFGKWNALRDEDWAAYIGLTLPRYMVRLPWDASDETQSGRNGRYNQIGYVESVNPTASGDETNFLWGNASMLFARNVVRSFEQSGWAQHIRGPLGGGEIEGLATYTYRTAEGKMALVPPVEIAMPDYREYQFARNGLIPMVHKKGSSTGTFFSSQSIKRAREFVEEKATQNSALVTNLAYTYSVTIIAHYVKVMMREYIGTSADAAYINQVISDWLNQFVTTVVNPDDLTLLYYPFKAVDVKVEPRPGAFGWYSATISILPHLQFEGMDVELRIEAALGSAGG